MDQRSVLTSQSDIREVGVLEQGGEDFCVGTVEVWTCKSDLCVGDFHFGDYKNDKTGICTTGPNDAQRFRFVDNQILNYNSVKKENLF